MWRQWISLTHGTVTSSGTTSCAELITNTFPRREYHQILSQVCHPSMTIKSVQSFLTGHDIPAHAMALTESEDGITA